jgi:F-box and WD-40 domain protein 1/11
VSGDFVYVGKAEIFSQLFKLDISTLKLSESFEGHESSVFALAMSENLLFSGSADTTIICWNSDTGSIIRRFIGHSNYVYDLKVLGNGLYSTDSGIIIKWNINDGLIAQIFSANHALDVRSILLKERSLFSGSLDGVVMRWDIFTGLPFFTYKEYDKSLRTIVLWANLVISGGDDGKLKAWDTSVQDIEPYFVVSITDTSICSLCVYGYTLFSGSSDSAIREWNLTNFHYQKNIQVTKYFGKK